MMCFGGLGLGYTMLRCVVGDAGGHKDMRKRGRADRGPTRKHGNLHQCDNSFISITVFFADNFVQYGTSLPHINKLDLFAQPLRHY